MRENYNVKEDVLATLLDQLLVLREKYTIITNKILFIQEGGG